MQTKIEKIQTKVIGYDNEKQAIKVNPITFENGHNVHYVRSNYILNPGSLVYIYLHDGVIPKLTDNDVILKISTTENYKHLKTNGISSKNIELILYDEKEHEMLDKIKDNRLIEIVQKVWLNVGYYIAIPKYTGQNLTKDLKEQPNFGGNFIFSDDERFKCKYPIPLFDNFKN